MIGLQQINSKYNFHELGLNPSPLHQGAIMPTDRPTSSRLVIKLVSCEFALDVSWPKWWPLDVCVASEKSRVRFLRPWTFSPDPFILFSSMSIRNRNKNRGEISLSCSAGVPNLINSLKWQNLCGIKISLQLVQRSLMNFFIVPWNGGSCSTAVEQNSWGHGFDSRWVQGFFLLFLSLSSAS